MDRKFAVADIEIGAQELEVAGGNARANIRKVQQISKRGDDRGALEPANVVGVADLAGRADAVGRGANERHPIVDEIAFVEPAAVLDEGTDAAAMRVPHDDDVPDL